MAKAARKVLDFPRNTPDLWPSQPENDENKPWHRLPDESALWHIRFRIYVILGPKRSLAQAVLADRATPLAPKSPENDANFLSGKNLSPLATPKISPSDAKEEALKLEVPGSWKDASRKYRWVERACQYDLWVQAERHRKRDEAVKDCDYADAAFRILVLNNLAVAVREHVSKAEHLTVKESCQLIQRLQSLMRDIRYEMKLME